MLDEIRNHIRLMVTYRNNDFIVGDDADGDGDVGEATLSVLYRYAQNGQQPVTFGFRSRAFIGIGYIV